MLLWGLVLGAWCFSLPLFAESASVNGPSVHVTKVGENIDLVTVLRLAGSQNLDVQIARERLAEAKANQTSAQWQFFPWLAPGISYRHHEGRVQAVDGVIFDASKQSYSPGVALNAQVDLGESYYRSLAAKQFTKAADHALSAQRQDSALAAAQGYFDLLFAQSATEVARESVRISTNYQSQIEQAVEAGVAFRGDALRVKVQSRRNQLALEQAEQEQKLASAKLAQILRLDPTVELQAENSELIPLSLTATNAALDALVQQAMENRAELKQGKAASQAARENKNGAIYGPMIPSLGAQISAGGLGGGTGGSFGNFGDQEDYLFGLSWRIGPGGLFDSGRIKSAEARAKSAKLSLEKLRDEISRQVVDSAVKANSFRRQINMSKEALQTAEESLKLAQLRKEFAVGIVLENIQAEEDLTRSRRDYLRAIAEHNKAQYNLAHALGQKF